MIKKRVQTENSELKITINANEAKLTVIQTQIEQQQKAYRELANSEMTADSLNKFCPDKKCSDALVAQQKACSSTQNRGWFNSSDCRKAQKHLQNEIRNAHKAKVANVEKSAVAVQAIIDESKANLEKKKSELEALEEQSSNIENLKDAKSIDDSIDDVVKSHENIILDEKLLLLDAKTLMSQMKISELEANDIINKVAEKLEEKLDSSALGSYIHNQVGQALSTSAACDAVKSCMEGHGPSPSQDQSLMRESKAITDALKKTHTPAAATAK